MKIFSTAVTNIFFLLKSIPVLLKQRSIRNRIFLAILINLVSFFLLVIIIWGIMIWLITFLQTQFNIDLYNFIELSIFIIFLIASFISSIFIFPGLSSILNSLIYASLHDKVLSEVVVTSENNESKSNIGKVLEPVKVVSNAIGFEIKKLIITGFIFFVSLLLLIFPFIGSVIFIISNTINLIIVTGSDLFEPIFSAKNKKYRNILGFIFRTPDTWIFLWIIGTINSIPIINIFTLPLTTVSTFRLVGEKYNL